MNPLTMTKNLIPVADQLSVPVCSAAVTVSVAVYPRSSAQSGFVAFGMASIGADAAAHPSDVWGLPCTSLVSSKCTETNKRRSTNKRHNTTTPAITSVTSLVSVPWLLRPSGVQGDPPV